ncbi:hypothetical protein ABZX98_32215 [Streptomyces sp. NPDC002992]|uniref:hypothetical protein n=1 Tax=Streptomyces sp. NPDC002992 TaxID=3154273 RepID=UPI0033B7DF4A
MSGVTEPSGPGAAWKTTTSRSTPSSATLSDVAAAPVLPRRLDLAQLTEIRRVWGVSVDSLICRCRELGMISDATASRGYQRLRALDGQPGFAPEPVDGFPGEQPTLLTQAYELAEREKGLTIPRLADELGWHPARVRRLLGSPDPRPILRIV